MDHPIVKALRGQIAQNTRERTFLDKSLKEALALFPSSDSAAQSELSLSAAPTPEPATPASPPRRPGGPRDSLVKIIGGTPGISAADARHRARGLATTVAKDPARSVEEALRRLKIDKVVVARNGGGLYLAEATNGQH